MIHIRKKLIVPIYHSTLHFVISDDFKTAIKKAGISATADELQAEAVTYQKIDKNNLFEYYIFIHPGSSFGDIAHESVHFKNYLFGERGIHLDTTQDEHEAYLIGWVIDEVTKIIVKNKLLLDGE